MIILLNLNKKTLVINYIWFAVAAVTNSTKRCSAVAFSAAEDDEKKQGKKCFLVKFILGTREPRLA